MKVNFLIGGTQKGGTSALDAYLRRHPEIVMANQKEVHFFDNEDYFRWKEVDYSLYHASFTLNSSNRQVLGEATPIYMYWYPAPKRIWYYNPCMKWILVLRNPIERAYSHWNMESNRGQESVSFLEAVKHERKRCREMLPEQHRVYSYVDRGFYTEQIRRIWHFFPIEQTLFIKNEELRHAPRVVMDRVCNFLQVGKLLDVRCEVVHAGEYVASLSAAEKVYLQDIFEVEIRALEKLLGWDCRDWLI